MKLNLVSKTAIIAGIFCLCILFSQTLVYAQAPSEKPEQPHLKVSNSNTFQLDSPHNGVLRPSNPLSPGSPSSPAFPWSKLVYQYYSTTTSTYEIHIANDDGSGTINLADDSNNDIHPRLSLDAQKVAFASNRAGNYEIYLVNSDGSNLVRLTNNTTDDVHPVWSPDGSKIAFTAYRDGQAEIYVMNADGSNQVRLTNNAVYDGEPYWSPNSAKIAFTSYRNSLWRIWVMDADGSNQIQLSNQAYSEDPAWSPDGSKIAFDSDADGDGDYELWVMNADGSNAYMIRDNPTNNDWYASSWSPDSLQIVYTIVGWTTYNGASYWTAAYVSSCDLSGNSIKYYAGNSDLAWNGDWRSTDIGLPAATLQALPPQEPYQFSVSWSGYDVGISGFFYFEIQVRDGLLGTWNYWKSPSTSGSDVFTGIGGHHYYFRIRAFDNARNASAFPADYNVSTMVENLPPQTRVLPLPAYSINGLWIPVETSDPGNSGLRFYQIQSKDITAGADWVDVIGWGDGAPSRFNFGGTPGHTYGFRMRANDYAQNQEDWPANPNGDTTTTLCNVIMRGTVRDSAGRSVQGAALNTARSLVAPATSGADGGYLACVQDQGESITYSLAKTGYGSPTQVTYGNYPNSVIFSQDVYLPPVDNVVVNPGLEFSDAITTPWSAGGTVSPTIRSDHFTGATSLLLSPFRFETPTPAVNGASIQYSSMVVKGETVHVAWAANQMVYYAQRNESKTWSAPLAISGTLHYQFTLTPNLLTMTDGSIFVWWLDPNPLGGTDIGYARRSPEGVWSSPSVAYTITDPIDDVKAVSEPGSLVYMAWVSGGKLVYMQRNANASWTAPTTIFTNNFVIYGLNLQTDGIGGLHIIWTVSGDDKLYYLNRKNDGTWAAFEKFPVNGPFSFIVESTGTLHYIWNEGATALGACPFTYKKRPASGAWSAPAKLPCDLTDFNPNAILSVFLQGGTVHAAWVVQNNFNYHAVYTSNPGGIWSPVVTLPLQQEQKYPYHFQLLVDQAGHAHVNWSQDGMIFYTKKGLNGFSAPLSALETGDIYGGYQFGLTNSNIPVVLYGGGNLLFSTVELAPQPGTSTVSQQITLPQNMAHPILSFMYRLSGADAQNGGSLAVQLTEGQTTNTLWSTSTNSETWTHKWLDLSNWTGKTVTVTFTANLTDRSYPLLAFVDEITAGSISSDAWVNLTTQNMHVLPGKAFQQTIQFGNLGPVPADHNKIVLSLPTGVTLVSASLTPSKIEGNTITWDLGTIAGASQPQTIQLGLSLSSSIPTNTTISAAVSLQNDSTELETGNNSASFNIISNLQVYLPAVAR